MIFSVWITGYPGSRMNVEASTVLDAMRIAAREWRAHHHGEIIEINSTTRRFARIDRDGRLTLERG